MTCVLCAKGPIGIEGHENISLVSEKAPPKASVLFRCRACGQGYTRNYAGDGVFLWTAAPDGSE
jgi:hypothetical protein